MVLYCHYIAIGRPAFLAWTEIQEQYFLISVVCTEEWYKWVHLCEVLVCVIYLLDTDIHKKVSRTITVIRVTLLSFSACISPYLIDYGLFGRYYILLHDTWVLQEADSPSSDPIIMYLLSFDKNDWHWDVISTRTMNNCDCDLLVMSGGRHHQNEDPLPVQKTSDSRRADGWIRLFIK